MRITLINEYILQFRQAEFIAINKKECYPDWVVFFYLLNMSLSNTPSEVQDSNLNNTELAPESQNRVNAVATQAIDILDKNPDGQKAVRDMFDKMIAGNMRDPENVFKLQK